MQKIEWEKANAMTDGITIYCRECVKWQAKSCGEELNGYLDGASRGGFASVLIEDRFVCACCENRYFLN